MVEWRVEKDSLGEIAVPAAALWGAQTQRSLQNFPFGPHERMPIGIVRALALIKQAAAVVNQRHGLDSAIGQAIVAAASEVAAGRFDDQFPLSIWQTGSGTQTNMNVNEVIAHRASQALGAAGRVHPNDHVNRSQSSNDSFPSAMHMAVARATHADLLPALDRLIASVQAKAQQWQAITKIGRTHMQDAAPLTLGQEFSGYADQLTQSRRRLEQVLADDIMPLAQGATAVGTGLNAPAHFAEAIVAEIARLTGLPFRPCDNLFAAIAGHEGVLQFSATLSTLAAALNKIANDVRLLGSGPDGGIGELRLPANEPGSSIMPGKVNPTQAEAMLMVCIEIMGSDVAVQMGGAEGNFELNAFRPIIITNYLHSALIMADMCDHFRKFMIEGAVLNEAQIKKNIDNSLMMVTALSPVIGYDKASVIAHYALDKGLTLKEAALANGVSEDLYDKVIVPINMTHPGSADIPAK